MKFMTPTAEELAHLRADPLLWEQELDVRPDVAEAVERAVGLRAGRVYWRSVHDHLYAIELADLGRGRPSMAMVHGFWDRYEPRPPEHEIDADLLDFSLWVAEVAESLNPEDVAKVAQFARVQTSWPQGTVLRTPEDRFVTLPEFPYEPHYVKIEGLRIAFVESGAGDPILMLHGEPTWSFLYRHMIPTLAEVGLVIAPDLIGFGRSDKPVADNAYSYRSHARWVRKFIETLDLRRITLVCQDWGGLLGLRVLAQIPHRFARLVAMNTGIPDGGERSEAFVRWRRFAQQQRQLAVSTIVERTLANRTLTAAELAAYDAPFPSSDYQTGALVFPRLVPIYPDHPGAYDNRVAIEILKTLDLSVLLLWGDSDPVTGPWEAQLRAIFRNVAPPLTIKNAGHFLQEDAGAEVASHIRRWMEASRGRRDI
jgi:haloalkane dehalogenase